jgi:hypothetical protein
MSANKIVGTPDLLKTFNWSPTNPQWAEPSASLFEDGYVGGDKALASNVNFIYKEFGEKINHVLQNGVTKWISTKAYLINDVVNHSGRIYQTLVANTNSEPTTSNTNWTYLGNKADLQAIIDSVTTANSNIATNTSNISALDIVKNPTVTGNSLKIPRVNAGADAYEAVTFDALLPSQTGNAGRLLATNGTNTLWTPNTGAFAIVNFDGTTASNLTGTATRASNVATINATAHGHIVGHRVYLTFASGITNGWFVVATVPTANSFTVASTGANVTTPVNATLQRRSIRKTTNIQSIVYENTGVYGINFSTPAPDANYVVSIGAGGQVADWLGAPQLDLGLGGIPFDPPTNLAFYFRQLNVTASFYVNPSIVRLAVFA